MSDRQSLIWECWLCVNDDLTAFSRLRSLTYLHPFCPILKFIFGRHEKDPQEMKLKFLNMQFNSLSFERFKIIY